MCCWFFFVFKQKEKHCFSVLFASCSFYSFGPGHSNSLRAPFWYMVYARFEFNSFCFDLSLWILLLLIAWCSLSFVVLLRLPSSTVILHFILFIAFGIWFLFNCCSTVLNIAYMCNSVLFLCVHIVSKMKEMANLSWENSNSLYIYLFSFISHSIRFRYFSFRPWTLQFRLYALFIRRERAIVYSLYIHTQYNMAFTHSCFSEFCCFLLMISYRIT